MKTTQTVIELHQELQEAVKSSSRSIRDCTKMKVGEHSRHGDCYFHRITERPECWDVETTDQTRQVAVGQGEGSHHCAKGAVRVFWPRSADAASKTCPIKLFDGDNEARLQTLGPIIEAPEGWIATHPHHAHHEFGPGLYLTTFQLDRRTMRRVQD